MIYRKSRVLLATCFTFFFAGVALAGAGGHHAHWSYTGDTGPAHWGTLDPAYATCGTGKSQSPIDLQVSNGARIAPPVLKYQASKLSIVNNGHTVQVNIDPGSEMVLDGDHYSLKQFHFHTPSEHTRNGKHFPMEIHFVHADAKGRLAVVGVLVKEGHANPMLDLVLANAPMKMGHKSTDKMIKPHDLMPANTRAVLRYPGSLTTPPCSEGVRWTIMDTPIEASREQIAAFMNIMHHNNRPVQPLNGRVIAATK